MGTDRFQVYKGPCECGNGEYLANHCTPDHPYPTNSQWWECEITCPRCAQIYKLEVRGRQLTEILISDVQEREGLQEQWYQAEKGVMERSQHYLNKFAATLREQSSVAAIYRYLKATGIFPLLLTTEQTFRRHWQGAGNAERWVNLNVRVEQIPSIIRFLGHEDRAIEAEVQAVENLYRMLTPPSGKAIARI